MNAIGQRVLVVGQGGHATVCSEALVDGGAVVVATISTDGADIDQATRRASATHVFIAIGDNAARVRLLRRCSELGLAVATAVSRHAMVSGHATIGAGVALLPGAVVNAAATLRDGVIVNTNSSVDHDCTVGTGTHIAPGCAIAGGVTIGDGVLVGVGARVLPGIRIGNGATVGAGAVVTRDVADGSTVVGVPARPVGDARR